MDLFGGSPYNAAVRFTSKRENTDVVSGFNIPMLLEAIPAAGRKTATLAGAVAKAEKAGTKGIRSFQAIMNPPAETAPAQEAAPVAAPAPVAVAPVPGDGHMDITFIRIDSRLIHGQVAGNWVNHLAPQTLIAAFDSAAQDKLRKTLLLQVAPSHIKTNVLDIAKTGRVYHNPKYTA